MRLKTRRVSLRTKIITWSFVPTVIILLAVALVILSAFQNVTEELVLERDREVTFSSAGQLETKLGEYEGLLTSVARTGDIYQGDPAIQRDALQRAGNQLSIFDGGVLLLDTFGTIVAVEPERPVLGQDWSDRTYYQETVSLQRADFPSKLILSDIVTDGPGGTDVIVCALPVLGEQNEFRGMLLGMFRVEATATNAFYGDIVTLRLGNSGSSYLVDGNGRVIYHSVADHIGEDFSVQTVVQQVLSGHDDAIRTRDFAGKDIVAGFAPVPGTSWGLVTEETWAALISNYQSSLGLFIFLLVLGVLLPIIVVSVGVRRITNPITDLMNAAQEVAQGNFDQIITAQTGDEIEELAGQFNLMAAQLEESYAHLEQRVADRTRDLAMLNAIAGVVSRSLDLDAILSNALDETLATLDVESGIILLTEPGKETMTPRAHRGLGEEFVEDVQRARLDKSILAVTQGKPLVLDAPDRDDAASVGPVLRLMLTAGIRTLVGTPLIHKDQTLGALTLVTRQPRVFSPQELALLASIGQQIGVGVKNAWLYTSVQQELVERKRAEAQLQQYAAKLEDANEELSQYAYVVSHDLKTPLRAVRNYSDFLTEDLEGTLDTEQNMYLDGLGRAVQEAENLVDDLLELSRIGRRHVTVEAVDVGAFLREQITALDLSDDVETVMVDEWPTVDVELVLFGQIFQNLIVNATKFNNSPRKWIELGWRQIAPGESPEWNDLSEESYEFFVRDNGIGIEARYHAQIFRVFERLHTKEEYEGTGIGLAIVKKASGKLGGSVRVESKPGEGSTFFVTLPKTRKEN